MKKTLKEALTRSYAARSRFFYIQIGKNRWQELRRQIKEVMSLRKKPTKRPEGVSNRAWEILKGKGIDPREVFCYSEIIDEEPELLDYYRLIAALSQKGLGQLLRGEKRTSVNQAIILNQIINELVVAFPEEFFNNMESVVVAEIGSETQGSWVNLIGKGAAKAVRDMIFDYARIGGYVAEQGKSERGEYLKLTNGWVITFADEPDVSIHDDKVVLRAAVEVKGSMDVAGAQTRYGEAKKSFGKALKENPRCETIYLCSCLTPAVVEQIEEDGQVRQTYVLPDILSQKGEKQKFLEELFTYIIRI